MLRLLKVSHVRASLAIMGALLCGFQAAEAESRQCNVYIGSFQSGEVLIYDPAKQSVVKTIPVEDGAGVVGIAPSSDGSRLYLVDGNQRHRLRVLDAGTLKVLKEEEFGNRVLELSARPVIHLTADDRQLFVKTFDYAAAAHGIRVFDIESGRFAPVGLQRRRCDTPTFLSARNGTLVEVCPGFFRIGTSPSSPSAGEGRAFPVSLSELADAVLSADGQDLYLLGAIQRGKRWRLVHFSVPGGPARGVDLPLSRRFRPGQPEGQQNPTIDVSADGNALAIVGGDRAWILEPKSYRVRREFPVSGRAAGGRFCPGTHALFVVGRNGGGQAITLTEIDVQSGKISQSVIRQAARTGPMVWRLAPQPP